MTVAGLFDAYPPLSEVRLLCGATPLRAHLWEDRLGDVGTVLCHGRDEVGRGRMWVQFEGGPESAGWFFAGEVMRMGEPVDARLNERR